MSHGGNNQGWNDDDHWPTGDIVSIHEAIAQIFVALGRIEGKLDRHIAECPGEGLAADDYLRSLRGHH
jgi:hypothetical protein